MLNTLEKSKNMTHCVSRPLQVCVSPVQQGDGGVVHSELSLVHKLQWVHGVTDLGPKALQSQSLSGLHAVRDQQHWPVVVERAGTCYLRHGNNAGGLPQLGHLLQLQRGVQSTLLIHSSPVPSSLTECKPVTFLSK